MNEGSLEANPTHDPRERWRSSRVLRWALPVFAVALLWVGVVWWRATAEQRAVAAIQKHGGTLIKQRISRPNAVTEVLAAIGLSSDRNERLYVTGVRLDSSAAGDSLVPHLHTFAELDGLGLNHTDLTDEGLKKLSGLKHLDVLEVGGTRITDAGLKRLENLPELSVLSLNRTAVTDAGMHDVARFSSLLQLHLAGTKVTDAGIKPLHRLRALEYLTLSDDMPVSDEALRAIKAANPQLTVLIYERTEDGGLGKSRVFE